ncbi:TonB-dependent receptor [Mucilaginibacter sp.]|uniref:TonB-dependent receptor n=1 Tax=Mucilaginibacter sp. TaxID=1882438 RepID=UPI000CC61660|nr:TonB-dependent receptor [Mucilaginibacter sp.]PLW90977.1 MAG: TonB-dependent receptor [Mucilaginibacter sp.]PMP66326.1 MAG: TonB-dependent receptor [Mucilaginibacter sp.]HEK21332.1 TonB-dependent receptor [Bacteroidota bacterium]
MKVLLPLFFHSFRTVFIFLLVFLCQLSLHAQNNKHQVRGTVTNENGDLIAGVSVELNKQATTTDQKGIFFFDNLSAGNYTIKVSLTGYEVKKKMLIIKDSEQKEISFQLQRLTNELKEVVVKGYKAITGLGYLNDVHNGIIYAGKKTEVILLDSLDANTAQNNPRQVLGRIPGANYSETEGGGFPSNGIGFRGLNPTQSVETNTRQNGYNITADIYGYPEAYYLPALEAIERIEVTRGAASLQFGPQFGGVINYITKQGVKDKPLEITIQETGGSFGLFNAFTSAGGTIGKWHYYGFIQYKNIQGWRPNSDVQQVSGFAGVNYQANARLKLGFEYSILRNRIHMPGGFDDAQFNLDSRGSYRARNWLRSPWNIITAISEYKLTDNTVLHVKSSVLLSARDLVWKNEDGGPGELDSISPVTNTYVNREVQREKFTNWTTEARLLHTYKLFKQDNTLAAGVRIFTGKMKRQGGGEGTTGSDFDLTLLDLRYEYDLDFTTLNIAPFLENTFKLNDRFSITPGIRYEYINSTAKGYVTDGNDVLTSDRSKNRYVALFGIGLQYKTTNSTNIYGNISQAYRPVTYDQLTPFATTAVIDPNMKDADGYNADLGWRGSVKNYLNFDVSGFYLRYNNRIGIIQKTDAQGNDYAFRTNVANSVHQGVETYIELNMTRALFPGTTFGRISFFNSFSFVDARYTTGEFKGKYVEYAPQTINRVGVTYAYKPFSTTFLISNTAKSYADATNALSSPDPAVGLIRAYQVLDCSGKLTLNRYNLKLGVNNLADKRYFTIRTNEYPGPGIIPAIGRSFYFGIGAKF